MQQKDLRAQKIRAEELQEDWKDLDGVFHYQGLSYVPKIIRFKLISKHHNKSLMGYFGINKIWELFAWKYYWPSLKKDVEAYVKACDVCLAFKVVKHKPYSEF